MAECAARGGAGSGAAHLVSGHGPEHAALEEELAAFTGRERALLFSTGYMANLAVMATLAGRGEQVLLDRLSHASLIDGALLSGARFRRYPHGDAAAAAAPRRRAPRHTSLLATDGVFSMDGDSHRCPSSRRPRARTQAWLVGRRRPRARRRRRRAAAGRSSTSAWTPRRCRCWSAPSARPSAASAPSSPGRARSSSTSCRRRAPISTRPPAAAGGGRDPRRTAPGAGRGLAPRAGHGAHRALPPRRARPAACRSAGP